jgi:low affinity Fe/Cu permease
MTSFSLANRDFELKTRFPLGLVLLPKRNDYSNTWQLVVNTATTIVTFLMVFLIQNTQNRDARAIHLKLDEIIRSIRHAHNEMIDIEKLSDEELETLSAHFEEIRAKCEERKQRRAKLQRN